MALNHYSTWKNILVTLIVILGVLYALPNLFGEAPAIQISALKGPIDSKTIETVESTLTAAQIPYQIETTTDRVLVRFDDTHAQLIARDLVAQSVGDSMVVALNLAPKTPEWLKLLGAKPMKLGLDLRGGVHFLMEIDTASLMTRRLETYLTDVRTRMREDNIRYRGIELNANNELIIRFEEEATLQQAEGLLSTEFPGLDVELGPQSTASYVLQGSLSELEAREVLNYAVDQTMMTLRNRVNELGVSEAIVQRQGAHRIVIELPGVQDTAMAKEILGKTATLEFRLVNVDRDASNMTLTSAPADSELLYETNGAPVLVKRQIILSGESIVGAQTAMDEFGKPSVSIQVGGDVRNFSRITGQNVGKPLAAVFIESKFIDKEQDGKKIREVKQIKEVISVATINSALPNRFQITGLASADEARTLALLLRAGALPAPIDIVEERTVGPSLGADNIKAGIWSTIAGLSLVLLFMLGYYRAFGLIADIALVINLILIIALLSILGATLTLPGIAAIVLTLGMAVDANVLIFERIREELTQGNGVQASIYAGFEKAFVTIIDAQLTTFIAALALFSLGSGPVKGFAVTLIIGLVTSVFTAVVVSRAIVNKCYGERNINKLSIGK
ncbi:MAG TPA: protein translocase subunit SecD [Gammaproteobacteria bacterium]|nr:protein translocase subunit SecD [Gammaproteobacteria bacterium]